MTMTLEQTRAAVPATDEVYREAARPIAAGAPGESLRAPGILLQALELRALWEHFAAIALRPAWGAAARGDGHPVLVLPGLAAGDASTAILRRFLISRGYAAVGWGQGVNLGLRKGVLERALETLRKLARDNGRKVSLVGWSLGGLYAREIAKLSPEAVRLVITLGSPFAGHPRQTNAWRLYEVTSGHRVSHRGFHAPLRTPPPAPTTSIWSLTDGIVSWRCSVEVHSEGSENIVVGSSHMGLGVHPATLFAVADRLAQPEGRWAPFHREGWRRLVYRDPAKWRRRLASDWGTGPPEGRASSGANGGLRDLEKTLESLTRVLEEDA